jgi:coenzyme F420-0:L-glutamate ligase / coenzyme F420-1:gamma-L-glutamate ligase
MDYETFLEFVTSRRSIRNYTDQPIDSCQVERLIEAACWAPSNHNRQGWKFLIISNRQKIRQMAEEIRRCMMNCPGMSSQTVASRAADLIHYSGAFDQAPVVILVMHKKTPSMGKSILSQATSDLASGEVISAAMACQNLLLAAHAMGLGACVMTAPLLAGTVWNSMKDLPLGFEPTCLITVGYSAEVPVVPRRKELNHVIEYR